MWQTPIYQNRIPQMIGDMRKQKFMTVNELLDLYHEPEHRERTLRLYELSDFLNECVIRRNYKIPDRLNDAIHLTEYGARLVAKAGGQAKVPPKVTRLTCLLELFYLDFLVDPMETDVDEVAHAISDELVAGNILLPFMFGPDLYRTAATLFEDRTRSLPAAEVLRLLEGKPQGVFHFGPWLSGPLGLLKTTHHRSIPPTRRIPLQHCHDVACRAVHTTHLHSDSNAEINRRRSDVTDILREESDKPSEFGVYMAELMRDLDANFDDQDCESLPYLLGDAFSDKELRALLGQLAEHDPSTANEMDRVVGMTQVRALMQEDPEAPGDDNPDHATLMQLCLLATNDALRTAIDQIVLSNRGEKGIDLPPGEVRRSVLTNASSTEFRNRPEVSNLGFRVDSAGVLGPLRLRRLVGKIFEAAPTEDAAHLDGHVELNWHLRDVSGLTVADRLDEYLRTSPPDEVIRRLVMSSKANVDIAFEEVGLELVATDDDTQIKRLLWKLGFDVSSDVPLHERFWHLYERMLFGAQNANVSTIIDQEAVRGLGANFFVALENLLFDTVAFVAWALTNDHVVDKHPFTYAGPTEATVVLAAVREELMDLGARADRKPEKWTLYPLVSSFRALRRHLESLQTRREAFGRPEADYPEFAGKTSLESFPFAQTVPFLSLTVASQREVLDVLEQASALLLDSKVHEVRNENLHHRQGSDSYEKLLGALRGTSDAVRLLERAGFVRNLFLPDRHEGDRWGRTTHYLRSSDNREVGFRRPSSYTWLSLPNLGQPQYLVHIAKFADPNEILRFRSNTDSEFRQMWSDYPLRRRRAVDWSSEEPLPTSQSGPANSDVAGVGPTTR
jgi:hypothetical protein